MKNYGNEKCRMTIQNIMIEDLCFAISSLKINKKSVCLISNIIEFLDLNHMLKQFSHTSRIQKLLFVWVY